MGGAGFLALGKGLFHKMNLCLPFLDGVVLVDPDYLKDRKGTRPKSRSWRGGRKKKKFDGLALVGCPREVEG